jgi:hypothetical protein
MILNSWRAILILTSFVMVKSMGIPVLYFSSVSWLSWLLLRLPNTHLVPRIDHDMMIMSMGWDRISQLRPPNSLLFMPQVIYEHGEPWWNDIERKTNFSTRDICQSYQQSHLVPSRRNTQIWLCKVLLCTLASDFLHAAKSYDMGPPALLPVRRKVCSDFYSP